MKKTKLLFSLLMAIVMMAMSPAKVWAEGEVSTISDGSSFTTNITNNEIGTWYPFTPATTGYYSFTISQAVQAVITDDEWNLYSSNQVCTTQKSFTKLVAGGTYYLALRSTGDAITGATVTVAACDAPTTTSTMTGTTTTETVPAYGVKYVKYVPTAKHRYSVSVTGANDASAVVLEKKGTDDYSEAFCTWVDDGWVYLFENGKEYALGLCNSVAEEKELTLTLNEDNATPFINGTSYTISTLESYGEIMLRLTPTETKEYTFSVNNEYVQIQIATEVGWIWTENDATSISAALTAGKTYYISIRNKSSQAFNNITITVSGGGVQPALALGDNTSINVATASGGGYVSDLIPFTPAESATYSFTMQGQDGCSVGIFPTASLNNALGTNSLALEHDVTYYVAVMSTSQITNGTLVVTKEGSGESGGSGSGGETTNVLTVGPNYVDIPENETAIFSFTPETTGWYRFYSEGENDMELNDITLNGESVISTAVGSNDYDTDDNFKRSIPLTAGSTYLLGISEFNGNAVEDCKIVVSYVTPSVLKLDDNSVTIPLFEIATYTFTPTETGSYRFYTEGDNDMEIIDITLNGESVFSTAEGRNDIDDDDFNFDWSIQLTKDNTYLLAIKEYDEDAVEDCNLVVSYEGSGEGGETPTYTALTVNDNTAHIYAYDESNSSNPKYYFTFTPAEPGEYTFSFSNGGSPINVYAALFTDFNGNSIIGQAVGQANGASYFTTNALTAEHTYYLCVDGNKDEYESATITITKVNGSGSSYQAVQEGQANVNEITIPAGEGGKLVQFTAPATFRFQFKTSASDYNVSLFSGVPGEEGTTCFASGLGECQYDCTGGKTYYILLSKIITMSADEVINLSILRVHQREMSYEWGTVCLPFPINYDPNNGNYKLYNLTDATSSQLTFTERSAGNILPGQPMAVKAVGSKNAETQKYTINIVASNTGMPMAGLQNVGDYTFKGTITEMTNQTGIYFIAQNKFWWAEDAITVPAYRAYLEGPAPTNGAKAFSIVVEDEDDITGILQLENGELKTANSGKYLENGRVVIVKNGKKFNINGQEVK